MTKNIATLVLAMVLSTSMINAQDDKAKSQPLTPEQILSQLDADGDNFLDRTEVNAKFDEVNTGSFAKLDGDGNGSVSNAEWTTIDTDANDIVSLGELQNFFKETESVIETMIKSWYISGPLIILSILAVYIFIERLFAITRALKEEKNFMSKIKDYIHDGKMDSAINLCDGSDTPIARMLSKGIARIGKSMDDIKASIENVGKLEIYNLEKNISTLATIAGAAPMIGFLGTVIGMVQVFQSIRMDGMKIENLSSGMMTAMVTTIIGLVVGVLAYMAYNYLVARVSKVIHKMEAGSIDFFDILEQPGK